MNSKTTSKPPNFRAVSFISWQQDGRDCPDEPATEGEAGGTHMAFSWGFVVEQITECVLGHIRGGSKMCLDE